MTSKVLIEMQYAGPALYYHILAHASGVLIEQWEHYRKATYRNRCYILGANGPLRLSVPLVKGKNQHTIIKDVKISYDHPWQKIHWQSLTSAYRTSPYFEYYEDRFATFYEKRFEFLWDFNREIMEETTGILKVRPELDYTDAYVDICEASCRDLRSGINPSRPGRIGEVPYRQEQYHQVFSDRFPFQADLSIYDVLFNLGPEAGDYVLRRVYQSS